MEGEAHTRGEGEGNHVYVRQTQLNPPMVMGLKDLCVYRLVTQEPLLEKGERMNAGNSSARLIIQRL